MLHVGVVLLSLFDSVLIFDFSILRMEHAQHVLVHKTFSDNCSSTPVCEMDVEQAVSIIRGQPLSDVTLVRIASQSLTEGSWVVVLQGVLSCTSLLCKGKLSLRGIRGDSVSPCVCVRAHGTARLVGKHVL